jgi:molybdopterin converting factor subunit 1
MMVRVHLFARSKDLAGTDVVVLDLGPNAVVADLRRQLAKQFPALAALLERSALAVNQEFARDDQRLTNDAEVALLPPVSGG